MFKFLPAFLCLALSIADAKAENIEKLATAIAAEAMLAIRDEATTSELGAGLRLKASRMSLDGYVGAAITLDGDAGGGTAVSSTYRREVLPDGRTICRDMTNGQFAQANRCTGFSGDENVDIDPYARLQLSFKAVEITDNASLSIGAGVRFSSDDIDPYGLVAVTIKDKMSIRAMAGESYQGVGINLGF